MAIIAQARTLEWFFKAYPQLNVVKEYISQALNPQSEIYKRISTVSGFEVLKRIKETPSTCHIPVIINSSMSSDSNHQMAERLKADGFISKSNPIEIEQALRQILVDIDF